MVQVLPAINEEPAVEPPKKPTTFKRSFLNSLFRSSSSATSTGISGSGASTTSSKNMKQAKFESALSSDQSILEEFHKDTEHAAKERETKRHTSKPKPAAPMVDVMRQVHLDQVKASKQAVQASEQVMLRHKFCPEFTAKYRLEDILGEGGFGFVASAVPLDSQQRGRFPEVAVKFILKEKVPISAYVQDPETRQSIPFEIQALKTLRHPNIVAFIDWFQDPQYFYLVTELHGSEWERANDFKRINRGPVRRRTSMDLFECIDIHTRFDEKLARRVFGQIVEAVYYLHHDRNLVHRDMKDENIVIDAQFHIKLIDFGAAAYIPDKSSSKRFSSFQGTPQYCPPEILKGQKYRGPEAEVWGLGVLLYTMLFGENPFNDPSNVINDHVSIGALAATSGCTVFIDGQLLVDSVPGDCFTRSDSSVITSRFSDILPMRRPITGPSSLNTTPILSPYKNQSNKTRLDLFSDRPTVRLSKDCFDLLECMLTRDPKTRLTIEQVRQHSWFS